MRVSVDHRSRRARSCSKRVNALTRSRAIAGASDSGPRARRKTAARPLRRRPHPDGRAGRDQAGRPRRQARPALTHSMRAPAHRRDLDGPTQASPRTCRNTSSGTNPSRPPAATCTQTPGTSPPPPCKPTPSSTLKNGTQALPGTRGVGRPALGR